MSAWLVSKRHIDCLVTSSVALGLVDVAKAHDIGELLYLENCRSLMARYGDRYERDGGMLPDPGTYVFEPFATEDLYFVLKQIACYQYQACEHHGWMESGAEDLTAQMQERILGLLGTTACKAAEHHSSMSAPWGVK